MFQLLFTIGFFNLIASQTIPEIKPSVNQDLNFEESINVLKKVTTPSISPKLDVVLLFDLTGSYRDDLITIRNNQLILKLTQALRNNGKADVRFGLASFRDHPARTRRSTDYPYKHHLALTGNSTAFEIAFNSLTALGGGDSPESQYDALFGVLNGLNDQSKFNFRNDATKVIILATDAPFHLKSHPSQAIQVNEDIITKALVDDNIKVVGIKAGIAGQELDRLATATKGSTVQSTSDSSNLVEAVTKGIQEITFTVKAIPQKDCQPLAFQYQPPKDTPRGTCVSCKVDFFADDVLLGQQNVNICGPKPTTQPPTTEAPTTEAPTTEAPTTEAPTTEAPTTEIPTTEEPEYPIMENPTTEEPTYSTRKPKACKKMKLKNTKT